MAEDNKSVHAQEPTDGPITLEELQLTTRNAGMPLEALRHDLTPIGMHYLLAHWDIPAVDLGDWRLDIGGAVDNPLSLSLDDLRSRRRETLPVTLECAGNGRGRLQPRPVSMPWLGEGVGTAEWTGTPLAPLLDEAGLHTGAVELVFRGADRGIQGEEEQAYARSLPIDEARRSQVLLAYEMNGEPLPPQHGFPLRLLVPDWYGCASVKWLESVEAVHEPFAGFQQAVAYRYQANADDPGTPVTRMRVRALMVPPGIPDFFTRRRYVDPGTVILSGRAWSGHGDIERVEVAIDGSWQSATLGPAPGEHAWRSWRFEWHASPGEHELACRARDSSGNIQPSEPRWNYQGMGNNAVQRVPVIVR